MARSIFSYLCKVTKVKAVESSGILYISILQDAMLTYCWLKLYVIKPQHKKATKTKKKKKNSRPQRTSPKSRKITLGNTLPG